MQPPEGDFSSQLQQYVNDRKRSRKDNDAPICNDFLNMHLLGNASMGRIAEKLSSALIIMEIILLWKRSFVRLSTSSV